MATHVRTQIMTHHLDENSTVTDRYSTTGAGSAEEAHADRVRRLREAGRDFTSGPGWVEYTSTHYAMGESWESRTRLEYTDDSPNTERS